MLIYINPFLSNTERATTSSSPKRKRKGYLVKRRTARPILIKNSNF